MYSLLYRHVLTRLDAEAAHTLTLRLLAALGRVPLLLWLVRAVTGRPDPVLTTRALGTTFPSPLGMAAGFDKEAAVFEAVGAFGFGFVEVGTVTAQPQPGNPRPRMARLPADRALVNRMGFNNGGAAEAAANLRHRRGDVVVGANIGKTKVVPAEAAAEDYRASARLLAPVAAYVTVNVSSPNTPGLRDLQSVESLRPILVAVLEECRAAPNDPPVLVKIAPDLADADVDAVADLAVELGLAGIIAANTTIGRTGLRSGAREVEAAGAGGLSGPVLAERSLGLLRRLHARVGDQLVLVSVGGIEDAGDAWRRITAGATLVQAYTGVVYGGPLFARRINRGLARHVRAAGLSSIAEAVGRDA